MREGVWRDRNNIKSGSVNKVKFKIGNQVSYRGFTIL
jgi:hypothetical protein